MLERTASRIGAPANDLAPELAVPTIPGPTHGVLPVDAHGAMLLARAAAQSGKEIAVAEKVLINLATGLDDGERVTVAFLVAGAAWERGREVAMFLT